MPYSCFIGNLCSRVQLVPAVIHIGYSGHDCHRNTGFLAEARHDVTVIRFRSCESITIDLFIAL